MTSTWNDWHMTKGNVERLPSMKPPNNHPPFLKNTKESGRTRSSCRAKNPHTERTYFPHTFPQMLNRDSPTVTDSGGWQKPQGFFEPLGKDNQGLELSIKKDLVKPQTPLRKFINH